MSSQREYASYVYDPQDLSARTLVRRIYYREAYLDSEVEYAVSNDEADSFDSLSCSRLG